MGALVLPREERSSAETAQLGKLAETSANETLPTVWSSRRIVPANNAGGTGQTIMLSVCSI